MENIFDRDRSGTGTQRIRPKRSIFENQNDRRKDLLNRHNLERNKYLRSRRMRSLLAAVSSAEPLSEDVVSEEGDVACVARQMESTGPQSVHPSTSGVDQQTTHFPMVLAHMAVPSLSWANQLTIPDMMIAVPPDLNGVEGGGGDGSNQSDVSVDSAGWLAVPRPRGRSCLVTAGRGVTIARDRNGQELARFHSLLPGGSKEKTSAGVGTIIECVFVPHLVSAASDGRGGGGGGGGVFVVIDVLAWKGLSYYDTGFDFRAFWAKCKFDEMNPSVGGVHSRSSSICMDEDGSGGSGGLAQSSPSYSFVLAPVFECDASGLLGAHSFAFDHGIERDGLLFCCKASRYEPGPTPLVLRWMDESCSSRSRFVKAEDDEDDDDNQGAGGFRLNPSNIALMRAAGDDKEDWGSVFPARLRVEEGFKLTTSDGFTLGSLASLSLSSTGATSIDDGGMMGHLAVGDLVDAHCTAMVVPSSSHLLGSCIEPSSLMNDDEFEFETSATSLVTKFVLNPSTPLEAEARFSLMLPIVKASHAHRHADSLSHLIWRARARAYSSSTTVPLPSLSDLLSVSMRKL